jgi:hypothetical protein
VRLNCVADTGSQGPSSTSTCIPTIRVSRDSDREVNRLVLTPRYHGELGSQLAPVRPARFTKQAVHGGARDSLPRSILVSAPGPRGAIHRAVKLLLLLKKPKPMATLATAGGGGSGGEGLGRRWVDHAVRPCRFKLTTTRFDHAF